jgi:hypothetical protein
MSTEGRTAEMRATCPCKAGPCEKFMYTFGDTSHICGLDDFHKGDHQCKECGRVFNADSVFIRSYIIRRSAAASRIEIEP